MKLRLRENEMIKPLKVSVHIICLDLEGSSGYHGRWCIILLRSPDTLNFPHELLVQHICEEKSSVKEM